MRRLGRKKIVCVIGTRPEAIKMAPLIRLLQTAPWARCRIVCTGQHRELVAPILDFFCIEPHLDLEAMRPGQSLGALTGGIMASMQGVLAAERPDLVLAQGDTATVVATALASFLHGIPFGHVEAGLRTGNLHAPFPEEANRVIVTHLSDLHFAPTLTARANLIREGISPDRIFLTGNTVIDSLLLAAREAPALGVALDPRRRLILVTAHRRDSIGEPLSLICQAIETLHDRLPNAEFLWPVHPNPDIGPVVHRRLSGLARVHLCQPLGYGEFVAAMKRSSLILTDSGGIQEEAPALGKLVLVLRAESERPEAVASGAAILVGHDPARIVEETLRIIEAPSAPRRDAPFASPFGDGQAAARIVAAIARWLGVRQQTRAAG
jgi:UDP-N-acetylglucosamine 2-epimerase (non-hydrolysing)